MCAPEPNTPGRQASPVTAMLDTSQHVATLVLDHSATAAVFQRHGIDFCCRGATSIDDACTTNGLDPAVLVSELEAAIAGPGAPNGTDPRDLSTAALIAHIIGHHHAFLRDSLPFTLSIADKVSRVHGAREPHLEEIADAVHRLAGAILPHLDQEEQSLFPALMMGAPDAELVERELGAMFEDHLVVGGVLAELRTLTAGYQPPMHACNSYQTLFTELARLEADVLTHVHLENHVLMPRFTSVPSPELSA